MTAVAGLSGSYRFMARDMRPEIADCGKAEGEFCIVAY